MTTERAPVEGAPAANAAHAPAEAGGQNLSQVVQGTAESILNQMETNLTAGVTAAGLADLDENELLQMSEPGPLGDEGREVEDVLNVISQSIYKEGEGQLLMKLSDRTSLLSVVSHSLSAYITTLEPAPLQRLSARIAKEVGMWVCKLFKFSEGAAYCHDDTREGLAKITRLALHKHYPKMATDGFEALFSRPPVIYLTSSTYLETLQFVCRQLGLPLSTIRLLKLEADDVEADTAAHVVIERTIQEDKAAGKMPILCVANVHSALIQGIDVCLFEAMCRRQDVWLHLEGNALAGLLLAKESKKKPIPTGDSMALTLGSWIGVPAVPFVTVYKINENTEAAATAAGLTTLNPAVRLNCLPLWCVLKSLGEAQLKDRIFKIFEMLEVLNNKLGEFNCLRVLSQRSATDNFVPVSELVKSNFDVARVYRTVNPALAFQYVSETPPDPNVRVPAYFNNLNSWLGQTMQRDCGQIPLEIVDVETTGYVLRLCPFESFAFSGVTLTDDDINEFVESIDTQSSILNATVVQREKFISLISDEIRLEHVDIAHWAGLGGVRYIPTEFIDNLETSLEVGKATAVTEAKENEGGDQPEIAAEAPEGVGERKVDPEQVRNNLQNIKDENRDIIDHRNIQLVQQLRNTDSAFSLGEGPDGRICIRFGMVSMETDVEELLALVIKSGMALDEQLAQLQNMSAVIRKGIEQAQGELQKESEEAIWQEGILRHVPLVGSFYNWISPLQKPQIKGRVLSLNEGKLEKSDTIYKAGEKVNGPTKPIAEEKVESEKPEEKGDAVPAEVAEENLKNSAADETAVTDAKEAEGEAKVAAKVEVATEA